LATFGNIKRVRETLREKLCGERKDNKKFETLSNFQESHSQHFIIFVTYERAQ